MPLMEVRVNLCMQIKNNEEKEKGVNGDDMPGADNSDGSYTYFPGFSKLSALHKMYDSLVALYTRTTTSRTIAVKCKYLGL